MSKIERIDLAEVAKRAPIGQVKAVLATVAAAVFLSVTAYQSAFTIDETQRGLRYTFGSLDTQQTEDILQPGLHWKIPYAQTVRLMPIDTQSMIMPDIESYTRDNQELTARLVVVYRTSSDQLVRIAKENPDYRAKLQELIQDRFKKVLGTKESADIANSRAEIMVEVTDYVAKGAVDLYGVRILDVQLPNFNFRRQFEEAVELAAVEKTKVKAQEQIKVQETIKAQTAKIKAKGLADAAIEAARGRADSIKLEADAVAYQIEKEGKAKAESAQKLANAIAKNPAIVQFRYAEQWNGQYPLFVGGEGMLPVFQGGDLEKAAKAMAASQLARKRPR